MNAATLVANWNRRRKAMALVMVVTTVALMSMLVVAIFSVTRTEYKASQSYVASRSAKQLADLAVVFTEAQLQNAQNSATGSFSRTIHATQPGMARVYKANGDFVRAHKLYSSSQMVITSANEADIFGSTHQVPQDWNATQNAARFVDLNDPIIRPGLTTGTMALYFPIIDPRAAYNGANPDNGQTMAAVEGFTYTKTTPSITGAGGTVTYNEVVLPADVGNEPNKLRLPMPVEWIYVLRDGTTGALDASNKFISADGATIPSASNPIVGRVAFWTDDESCKVNVNTASEPTFFAPPYFFHQRDSKWANFPPASGEYQRYPGHPATVALSTVLAPGVDLDVYSPNAQITDIVTTKDAIYRLIPKIAMGGSTSGTRPFVKDDFSSSNGESDIGSLIDLTASRKERLFASVDEMLFADGTSDSNYNYNKTNGRMAASIQLPGGNGRYIFDQGTLERSRFFLTSSSRSPEFSIHGLPRVAMWPVPDESLGPKRRTSFDNIIALCSTQRGTTAGAAIANSYFFRRADPHHPTYDVTGSSSDNGTSTSLGRNSKLLDYLYAEMATLQFPQTSSLGGSNNFGDKYGTDNVAQLAIMFFDYIRCTNLYDGVLARGNDGFTPYNSSVANSASGAVLTTGQNQSLYNTRSSIAADRLTFTEQRVTPMATGSLNNGQNQLGSTYLSSNTKVFPGHGQVSPARWERSGGQKVQGMGRMFTISEIGFQFICTADGYISPNDQYAVVCNGVRSGGGNAPRSLPNKEGTAAPATNPGNAPVENAVYPPPVPTNGSPYFDYKRWYSNYPPLDGNEPLALNKYGGGRYYGCDPTNPADLTKHPRFHPGYQPANWNMTLETNRPLADGTDPASPAEKRVQAMLTLEFFCPMSGWTKMFPEWAITLDGQFLRSIKLNNTSLFPSAQDVVIKSNGNVYETGGTSGSYPLGGHVGPSIISGGRAAPGWGTTQIGDDTNPYVTGTQRGSDPSAYIANPGSSNNFHDGLNNWGLISQFITVPRDQPMHLTFGERNLVIKIYDMHKRVGNSKEEVQSISLAVDEAYLPVPALVYSSNERFISGNPVTDPLGKAEASHYFWIDSYGREGFRRSIQAPHWWCFNRMGCINRMFGTINPNYKGPAGLPVATRRLYTVGPSFTTDLDGPIGQLQTGRLDTDGRFLAAMSSGAPTFESNGNNGIPLIPVELGGTSVVDSNGNPWSGSDVIRTFVPAVGDYRLAAARYEVPSTMWMKHPVWAKMESQAPKNQPRNIHSFTSHWGHTEPGVMLPGDASMAKYPDVRMSKDQQLVAGAPYSDARVPDLPPDDGWAATANGYGDFDNGIGDARDGPYVNKPDEGNFYAGETTRYNVRKLYRSGYFYEAQNNSDDWRTGIYMTPNRMVSSPVMFGSLPTGVWSGGSVSSSAVTGVSYNEGKPWQTLLFRPYASSNANFGKSAHPGDNNPRDHYLLDLFFMPVVEPYAISEPLSIAGRINLNYQIVPFTNITRATGLHAVMKGEFITAIPLTDTNNAKSFQTAATSSMWSSSGDRFWDESQNTKFWHRPIDVTKTLYQFDQKFQHSATGSNHALNRYRGLFRSPSQICEMHLIPDVSQGASSGGETLGSITSINATTSGTNLQSVMEQFWQSHSGTGDNTRERPYSNIYARVTTRSNTFRVHMRAQVITKARSTAADTMDPAKDAVLGEYRGSSLIERYIDPTDVANPLPDYGAASNPLGEKPLDTFFKFRTLESKRFSP